MKKSSTQQKNVPELRFPEFTNEWNADDFGKIAMLSNEKYNPQISNTYEKCIELENIEKNTGRLLDMIDSKSLKSIKNVFHKNQILFGKLRPNLRKYILTDFDGIATTEIWVIKPKTVEAAFLFYFIQGNRFAYQSQITIGSKMPRAEWSVVSSILTSYPNRDEQNRISIFLQDVDKLIENLKAQKIKLEEYKRGVMQKIFSREVRFKDENGKNFPAWKSCKLGDLLKERAERATDGDYELLSVTLKNGVTRYDSSVKKDSSSEDKSNYKIVRVGDIAYNTMRMWQGAAGVSRHEGIVSPAYTVVTPKNVDSDFFGYFFKLPRTIFDFYRYSQGLVSDTWNLKYTHFKEIVVTVPVTVEEQMLIREFLQSIDYLIEHKDLQVKTAEMWKKGLLQKMFV